MKVLEIITSSNLLKLSITIPLALVFYLIVIQKLIVMYYKIIEVIQLENHYVL